MHSSDTLEACESRSIHSGASFFLSGCCIVTLLVLMVVFGVLGFGCYRYGGKEETKAENKEPEIIEMWRVHMETAEMTAILEMRGLLPEDLDKELTNAMKKVGKVSLFHERDVREAYLKRTGLGAAHDKLVNLVKENDLYQEYRRVSPDACLDKATNMYQAMAKSIGEQLAAAAQNGW